MLRRSIRYKRKASLELSVRAIVIVVLAMTIMGLGLGFTRNIFDDISNVGDSTFSKIEEDLRRNLDTGTQNLVFSQSEFTIEAGEEGELYGWGIKNTKNVPLVYHAAFDAIKCPDTCPDPDELNDNWLTYVYGGDGSSGTDFNYRLGPQESHAQQVKFQLPGTAKPGLYLIKLNMYEQDVRNDNPNNAFDSVSFFMNVG